MTSRHPARALLWLLSAALAAGSAAAQVPVVTGAVVEGGAGPLPGATVRLLSLPDSALARGAVTDAEGRFRVAAPVPGDYVVVASFVGFADAAAPALGLGAGESRDLGTLALGADAAALDGVVVRARRPLFEQRADRIVVNVGESPTLAGGTALDVLERSPGVTVGGQGEVSIAGKSGVRLLVNGRPTEVPPGGLTAYLQGLGADAVERVEIITTPPASLQAEGDAGFVNVVLRRAPGDGLSGSASASAGYGTGEQAGDVAGASVSATLRRGALSAAATYSFARDNGDRVLRNLRVVEDGGGAVETRSVGLRDPLRHVHNGRLGLDVALTGRTTVGAVVAGYQNRYTLDNQTDVVVARTGLADAATDVATDELNRWRHLMGNVHADHDFGEAGRLSVDADALFYWNANPTDYLATGPGGARVATGVEKDTPFRIGVVALDYARPVGGARVAAGVRGSFARFANDVRYVGIDPALVADAPEGESRLVEDVLAAYLDGQAPVGSGTLRAGLRYEHERSDLTAPDGGALAQRDGGRLFPTVSYALDLGPGRSASASYARRVTRPAFSDLAPFVFFVDPTTFFTGNVGLRPSTSHVVQVQYGRGGAFVRALLSTEDDAIAGFQNRYDAAREVQTIVPVNVDRARTASLLVAVPVAPVRGWTVEATALGLWTRTEPGDAIPGAGPREQASVRLRTVHTLDLPLGLTAEADAYVQTPRLFGLVRTETTGGLSVGVQREVPGVGRLALSVSDVLDTDRSVGTTGGRGGPVFVSREVDFAPRVVRLTLSARFGGPRPDGPAPDRRSASEAEQGRVQ